MRYLIEDVECGVTTDVMGYPFVEAKFKSDAGEEFYLSTAIIEGLISFYKTTKSTFELQTDKNHEMTDEEEEYIQNSEIGNNETILDMPSVKIEGYDLYRYITYIAASCTFDSEPYYEDVMDYVNETKGKYIVPAEQLTKIN